MKALHSGLSFYINEVERLPSDTVFVMRTFDKCVIGQTTGWNKGDFICSELSVLNEFGIDLDQDRDIYTLFCGTLGQKQYKHHQWQVIKLFTSAVGDILTRDEWLAIAKDTLSRVEPSLKNGLAMIISSVEASKTTVFNIGNYQECVIGKTIGWSKSNVLVDFDWVTLNHIFDINIDNKAFIPCLGRYSGEYHTEDDWQVVRLFTNAVGDHCGQITKEEWLELAKQQLSKM